MKRFVFVLPLLLLLAGCGAQIRTLPVGEHHLQMSASVGGPMIKALGGTVPIPYLMSGATYGISDHVEVHGDVHVLAAMYKFLGFTPGITYFPFPDGAWVPSVSADALMFTDFSEGRVYPEVTLALAHRTASLWSPYYGLHGTFQTHRAPHFIPTAFVGTSYHRRRTSFYVELDWLAFNRNNQASPVDYGAAGKFGAIAPQIGFSYDWGRVK
jgi:hypothetical protein